MKFTFISLVLSLWTGVVLASDWSDAIKVASSEAITQKVENQPRLRVNYPVKSLELGEEGQAIIALLVGESGVVLDSKTIESSYPRLSAACASAFSKLVFQPLIREGVARKFTFQTTCAFKMNKPE